MKCWLAAEDLLLIAADDLPAYQKTGSVVRNNYYWALQAIAAQARRGQAWEFDQDVWVALARLLTFFYNSGYLKTSETLLEFPPDADIPAALLSVATWRSPDNPSH
ncbi:MAG: hypothetical protein VKJ27_07995 [Synechocystis sp.]|nr:hypothetical protein [Synechocystis sp.]